MTPAKIARFFD